MQRDKKENSSQESSNKRVREIDKKWRLRVLFTNQSMRYRTLLKKKKKKERKYKEGKEKGKAGGIEREGKNKEERNINTEIFMFLCRNVLGSLFYYYLGEVGHMTDCSQFKPSGIS